MTTGAWDPKTKATVQQVAIDAGLLQRLLALAESDQLDDLASTMRADDQRQQAIMQAAQSQWHEALRDYSNEQLLALMRFFTVVEMQLSHWVGGAKSPVIAINALLKQRGVKLDKAMLLWMRENSHNRFIPNGAVM